MTIGISLPLPYLDGRGESEDVRNLTDAFGRSADCLAELKANGVGAIEIGGLHRNAPSGAILEAAESIINAGLVVSVHGYLPDPGHDPRFETVLSPIRSAVESIGACQEETVLVVHTHSAKGAGPADMAKSTAASLAALSDLLKAQMPGVRLALEIQRYHGIESPGTAYEGLIDIEQRVVGHEICFCWDMGHTQSSVIQNRLPAQPPRAFLEKVIHTHIHGLSPDNDTHWPIIQSNAHVESGIRQLDDCGYDGIFNLELYSSRWGADISTREGILGSVRCLQDILGQNGEAP